MVHPNISLAERKHRSLLEQECRGIFSGTDMPSHDHRHHERVWENAAMLLGRLYDSGMVTDPMMAEKAIIASYFHDTGLTVNPGPDHGTQSRHLCSLFLERSNLPDDDKREILEAVEKHDDKDYPAMSDPVSLAAIISVADDMDAFGSDAIERYNEIYSLRGIDSSSIPEKVISNVESRLRHLETTYAIFPDLAEQQRQRAETVISHFRKLSK
ncbi:MAG: HD domain-containing protein [Bacteroidales bacterium]|jgi:HD superfamily phosphodiesterase|nr:HD domain-containing protein [Bacteroidales bacterium]